MPSNVPTSCISLEQLLHLPYLKILPKAEQLRTPLHFTRAELEAFKGTNFYGATLEREREWQDEWRACKDFLDGINPIWSQMLIWSVITMI